MRIGKRSPLSEIGLGLAGGEREIARRERNKAENLDLQIGAVSPARVAWTSVVSLAVFSW